MSYDLGKILIQKKSFSKALNIFSNKLKYNPNDLRANFQMGILFYLFNWMFHFIRNQYAQSMIYFIDQGELIELFLYIVFLMDITIKSYPRMRANACE